MWLIAMRGMLSRSLDDMVTWLNAMCDMTFLYTHFPLYTRLPSYTHLLEVRHVPHWHMWHDIYGVATISELLKIIGLFCRISSVFWGSFAKETYNFKEPTNGRHPIGPWMRCFWQAEWHVWHARFMHALPLDTRHDSLTCVTWLTHMCDMTHSHVWHDSLTCVTWLTHMCGSSRIHGTCNTLHVCDGMVCVRDMTHVCMRHDSVIHVTWLIRLQQIT